MNPDEFPDKTLEEAIQSEEDYSDFKQDWDKIEADIEERRDLMELGAVSAMLGRMTRDNKITLREYVRLIGIVQEYEDEWDTVL